MAKACADAFPPDPADEFGTEAHRLAYRALEHGQLRQACANPNLLRRLPPSIAELAQALPSVQAKRHLADYGPDAAFSIGEVADLVKACDLALRDFLAAPQAERRAFVAFVPFRAR